MRVMFENKKLMIMKKELMIDGQDGFSISECGVRFDRMIELSELRGLIGRLSDVSNTVSWALGDALCWAEENAHGVVLREIYQQLELDLGVNQTELKARARTARVYPVEMRKSDVPMAHYVQLWLAGFSPSETDAVMSSGARSRREIRKCISSRKQTVKIEKSNAMPLWDLHKLVYWAKKNNVNKMSKEQCEAIIADTKFLTEFLKEVQKRLCTLG